MISAARLRRRVHACATCPTPCAAWLDGLLVLDSPTAVCPLVPSRWSGPVGLGDVVAAVSQPFARAIDTVAGTDLAGCLGCRQRHGELNAAVPDVRHPFRRQLH